ncbi:MAG: hypothetical protein R3E12_05360 [Candidatus Eisenbacteria bacterium]
MTRANSPSAGSGSPDRSPPHCVRTRSSCLFLLLRLGLIGVPTLFSGCSLELPEAPYFETMISVPLGRERVSGQDLADENEFVIGDSTGTEPLRLRFEGDIDTVRIGDLLAVTVPAAELSASLDAIALRELDALSARFSIDELVDVSVPGGGDSVLVPPSRFRRCDARCPHSTTSIG